MVRLEERVSYLEGRAVEQASVLDAVRDLHAALVARMDRLEMRMDGFDRKLDQRFAWLVGIQVATLLAMVASFVGLAQLVVR